MMSDRTSPLNYAAKRFFKELVWRYLVRHRPDGVRPHIAVFSSRRGGSTLLMELLASNPGVGFSDQPFSLYTASQAQIQRLPLFEYGQVIAPDPDEMERIFTYADDILSGRLVVNGPWKFWQPGVSMKTNRMVLKITDAKTIAAQLVRQFGLRSVVMTRHPIAQALSVDRNGWDLTARAFLRNPAFVSRWLPGTLLDDAWAIVRGPDRMARRVLDWTLENLPLMEACTDHADWLFMSYEQLVMHPQESIAALARHCLLGNEQQMLDQLTRPSRSTKQSSTAQTRQRIETGDRSYIVSRWREKVPPEREHELLAICAHFGLDLYQVGVDEPRFQRVQEDGVSTNG